MKHLIFSMVVLTFTLFQSTVEAQTVVDFEDLNNFDASLPNVFGFQLLGGGDAFNGYGQDAPTGGFSSNGVFFPTQEFGPGFSYSRFQNATTPGFTNLFAAFPGGGSGGNGTTVPGQTYGLVATGAGTTTDGAPTNGAAVTFSSSADLTSIDIANSTFSALYLRDGLDGFAPEPDLGQQFANGDFFTLSISGFDSAGGVTGATDVDLARFENDSLNFIEDWETVDLTGFDNTSSLVFSLSSSDFDPTFGLNVPAFFAIDNLEFVAVPEPSSVAILGLGGLTALLRRRKS